MMLEGKVAMITGGTRGIGFAIVQTFLDNGAKVALCGSRQETADKAVAELKAIKSDYDVIGLAPDLMDKASIQAAMDTIVGKWGRLDILVNNAGISQNTKLYDYQDGEFEKIMNLNVTAIFNASLLAAKIMRQQHSGVILNTSSMVSLYGQPAGVGYPTSKFAVNGMTKSLARELAPDNIRVNAVAPGVIETDMVAALGQEMIDRLAASIPLKRLGQPQDIANAFLFLASDLASYVTGEILSVDGATMV